MGSLACLGISKRPLAREIQTVGSKFMWLGIFENSGVLANIEVLKGVRPVAYRLALPPNFSRFYSVFRVSILKKYHGDGNYIIKWDLIVLDKDLRYEEEPGAIYDLDV
ncbi:hypothetical protein MTR67_042722 [Solanum verrucosum]|uniref:Tf2-1-like SH3-like domain-containing protein n=1 Tax=Solanum verrucosum TaxID=315347 RepID=A0AAF0ZRE7_SOLVR|nr:hypothetical protein MTR67_042722 [Solanum verrucosum]